MLAVSPAAFAQDVDTSNWKCEFCPFEDGYRGDYDVGATGVSDDSAYFGNATGYDESGAYANVYGDGSYKTDKQQVEWFIEDLGLDSRVITLDGEDVTKAERDSFLARFGMLFQGGALFDSLPVWQNVAFRLMRGSLKRPKHEAREIAIEKLRRVGLKPDVADLFPAELSGGMQKRVGLARAIAAEPEIIFFDEPTTGLDPIMSGVINDLIREIVVEMGATAMTITHDMTSVRAIADNVAMLHDGVIQWTGPVARMDDSGDPYLTQFISGSAEGPIEAVR